MAPALPISLFLCGDVMTGRGIDQILPHPGQPQLTESVARSALDYVRLAERVSGPIPRPVDFSYVWGDSLAELRHQRPDARIINLETTLTTSTHPWPDKAVHYRMHPANAACLTAAAIDCCTLANNHLLDWGRLGLTETLDTLHRAGIHSAGAGRNGAAAQAPAILELADKGRLLVFSCATDDSGVPAEWSAGPGRPGVCRLADLSPAVLQEMAERVHAEKRPGDLALLSIHWGSNWDFSVSREARDFAHGLIDTAGVDLVHGHSSHHIKAIEIYRGRPILYGCGDFLNDYEGIQGYDAFGSGFSFMYFPVLDGASGQLLSFTLVPTEIRALQVRHAGGAGADWLFNTLVRESRPFGTTVLRESDGRFRLHWEGGTTRR